MQLGLIALSGVRAQNPELTKLGLTLPGFVERNRVIASLPSLGLLTLAGMTPPSIDLRYVEVPDIDAVRDVPGEFDAVAISSLTAQIKSAYVLADRYRSRGTPVIMGGLHVTAKPDEALQHASAVVLGEGELVWPAVMQDLQAGRLKPRYDGTRGTFNLAEAPLPRFELLDPERYNRLTVQTQRGCPYRCNFCASSIRLTPYFKMKPVANVVAEIQRIRDLWPDPFIEFADDNSFVNKTHAKALLRALVPLGIRWFTESDIAIADDPELLDLMRESGCAQVLIGLESPSPEGLAGLETRMDWKARQRWRYETAIAAIQSRGIAVNGCFVLGLDGTGPESFDAVFDFVRTSGLYEVQVTVQTAFPGTPLYEQLLADERLLVPDAWECCTLFDVNFKPQQMSVSELEKRFRDLVERLYSDVCTKDRRRRFKEQRRAGARHSGAERVSL